MARASSAENRSGLVEAAAKRFHTSGVAGTTIGEIAKESGIKLGSIYYYFRTKDDLIAAVVERRAGAMERLLERLDGEPDPRKRLAEYVEVWVKDKDIDARFGCPVGSLCFELARDGGPPSGGVSRLFQIQIDWCERQFEALGTGADSPRHALHLVSALQGISLSAAVFHDADMIVREAAYLTQWLEAI